MAIFQIIVNIYILIGGFFGICIWLWACHGQEIIEAIPGSECMRDVYTILRDMSDGKLFFAMLLYTTLWPILFFLKISTLEKLLRKIKS